MSILSRISRFLSKSRTLWAHDAADTEFNLELEGHLALLEEEFVKRGMPRTQAREAARRQFGNPTLLEQQHREARTFHLLTTLQQDIRCGLRMLRKSPGFTITAVLTLALGIGANAAIFTLVNAVLLEKLPVADPERLVRLGNRDDCCVSSGTPDSSVYSLFSTEAYQQLKKNIPEFEELAAAQAGFAFRPVVARRSGSPETPRAVMGEFVSGNYFRMFGLKPAAGRLLLDSDDVPGAPISVVMSFNTWQRDYAAAPAIVGSTFLVNTKPVTVAGIAPQGFYGDRMAAEPPDFYLPIETMPALANVPYVHDANANWLYILGRLRPNVQRPALEQKLNLVLRQQLSSVRTYMLQQNKAKLSRARTVLTSGAAGIQNMQQAYSSHLHLLLWISGTLLLIACANIANLLLVRGTARHAEFSIRTALGAGRTRILAQLLTESVLLAALSGLAGLALAYGGTRALLILAFPGAHAIPIQALPSLRVLAFASTLSIVTGILFGVAPAWISARANPVNALRSGKRATGGHVSWLQRGLVVLQAALSLILLVGAGLFAQSLNHLQGSDLHLNPENRYIVHINPQTAGYGQRELATLYRQIEDQFHNLPGVRHVGISSYTPMEDNNNGWGIQIEGHPELNIGASIIRANPEYFDSVGTRVLRGRGIMPTDTPLARSVAVINQSLAKRFSNLSENPLGRHFGLGVDAVQDFEIVGIVEDTAYTSVRWKDHAMFFIPLLQRPASDKSPIEADESLYAGAIVLSTSHPLPEMESLARKTLATINPNLSVVKFQTFAAQIADRFTEARLLARLTSLFGALALLLATLGLYGVTAYTVARRTAEIGIRMALGAERSTVTAMVMREAAAHAFWGLLIGIPIALACVRLVRAELYEVKGNDPSVMLTAVLTLAAAALLAGLIPARKATSIQPVDALRTE